MAILKDGDNILDRQEDIEQRVLQYYQNLFATDNTYTPNDLIEQVITPLVTTADNTMLTSLPSRDEVKKVVFSMSSNSAPGPDGFGGCFYHHHWSIIGEDVYNSVR